MPVYLLMGFKHRITTCDLTSLNGLLIYSIHTPGGYFLKRSQAFMKKTYSCRRHITSLSEPLLAMPPQDNTNACSIRHRAGHRIPVLYNPIGKAKLRE